MKRIVILLFVLASFASCKEFKKMIDRPNPRCAMRGMCYGHYLPNGGYCKGLPHPFDPTVDLKK
jgi:hypothetical protein